MSRRVEFNDGEGLLHSDLNLVSKLSEVEIGKLLQPSFAPTVGELRLASGSTFGLSGTGLRIITLSSGGYLQAVTPSNADDPSYIMGAYAGAAYTLDAPTSGSVYRRDILQAKIDTEVAAESETRHFKDAITGALSSTSQNKRRIRNATISVKKGADQTTEALADTNGPTPDAGYTKVYSVLVPPTGSVNSAKVWDWHAPLGGGSDFNYPGSVFYNGDFGPWPNLTYGPNLGFAGPGVGYIVAAFQQRSIAVGIRIYRIKGNFTTFSDNDATYLTLFSNNSISYTYNWAGDLTEGVGSGPAYILNLPKPIWSTGEHNRLPTGSDLDDPPFLLFTPNEAGTGDPVFENFAWDYYGS
jgi:hypothetical protein